MNNKFLMMKIIEVAVQLKVMINPIKKQKKFLMIFFNLGTKW